MSFDFLVIGGGIAGISAAAQLAPFGSLCVLEAEDQLGYHSSGRSAAAFIEDYGNDVVVALNKASMPALMALDGILKPRGMMLVGQKGEEERFATNAKGFRLSNLSLKEAQDWVPILDLDRCSRFATRPDVYDLDTDLLMQSLRKQAQHAGAQIETSAAVNAIKFSDGCWHLETSKGLFQGTVVINAAGAWADEVALMAGISPLKITPYRRSMARLPAPGGHDTTRWPFLDAVDDAWYAKPDAGELIVSPSEEEKVPPQDAWADDLVIAEGLARYEAAVTEPVNRVLTTWAGLRSFAPDRALVIGPDPVQPSFVWLAGQGGYGFQTCMAAADLTRDLVLGRAPNLGRNLAKALSPARFA